MVERVIEKLSFKRVEIIPIKIMELENILVTELSAP